ncbi:hypothetical protein CRUP_034812 [Coryphaenoides rupestris]|nr:hypothetical protein CRUP_034812 [Coryphaenoides rupestris]
MVERLCGPNLPFWHPPQHQHLQHHQHHPHMHTHHSPGTHVGTTSVLMNGEPYSGRQHRDGQLCLSTREQAEPTITLNITAGKERVFVFMWYLWFTLTAAVVVVVVVVVVAVANQTLHTDRPDLPVCFQLTVLSWLPCVYLWVVSPLYVYYLQRNNKGYIMMSVMNRFKTAFGFALWLVSWSDLFYTFHELRQGVTQPPIYFVTPLVVGMTMAFKPRGEVENAGPPWVWTPQMMAVKGYKMPLEAKDLWSLNEQDSSQVVVPRFLDEWEKEQAKAQSSRGCVGMQSLGGSSFKSSGFVSLLCAIVLVPLKDPAGPGQDGSEGLQDAAGRPKDLWSLNEQDSSQVVVPRFLDEWEKEQAKAQKATYTKAPPDDATTKPLAADGVAESGPEETEVLLSKQRSGPRQPSFLWALIRAFGPYFLIGSAYKVLQDLISFVSPQLLSLLIAFTKKKDAPDWWGYALAFLMFFAALLQTLILHQHFQYCFVTGMRLRTAIIGAIYRKSLVITNAAKRKSTVGEIVNLMSNLGPSVLAGLAVMVLLIPLNAAIAVKTRAYQVQQMQHKDARIKLMSEILNGIKVLKLYAWETSFQEKVLAIRQKELDVLRRTAYLSALSTMAWTSAPFLVALTTFAVYVKVDVNNVLDAEKAFASVSLNRIQNFLSHNELDPDAVETKSIADENAVTVINGKFTWAKQDPPTLHNITVMVPQGSLMAVVGHGSVAYVPQQAWIQNATLRDNILFGKAFEEQKYNCVMEACALTPDLQGINLSGGQRQRVSLARALYSDADVYLLDDPLSAVDAHVAKHIFDNLIGPEGALKGKTRILVTHGISFLPQVDNIVVMVDGRVSEMGSYQQLLDQNGAFADNHTDMVDNEPVVNETKRQFIRQISIISGDSDTSRTRSRKSAEPPAEKKPRKTPGTEKLIQAETTETGRVKMQVFVDYAKAVGLVLSVIICLLYACQNAAAIGANVWLSAWTNDTNTNQTREDVNMRVGVYASLGIAQGILVMMSSFTLAMGNIGAARKLHYNMLSNKFRTPQSFYDTTPLGRLINRFSKDIYVIDEVLPSTVLMFLGTAFSSLSTMIVIISSTPIFAVVIVPLACIYVFVQPWGAANQAGACVLSLVNCLLGRSYCMLRAARLMHEGMLRGVLRAPQAFFEGTPAGRLLNRFSKDVDTIDTHIPNNIDIWLRTFWYTLNVLLVCSVLTPMLLVVIVPLMLFYWWVQRFYVATSRQLKRLESVSRSPIYSHFSESITGASVIRGYGKDAAFVRMSDYARRRQPEELLPGHRGQQAFEEQKYNCVMEACALTPDLQRLHQGINLSGGQRQRSTLTSTCWTTPLSAVDAHVAKHIFDNLIGRRGR